MLLLMIAHSVAVEIFTLNKKGLFIFLLVNRKQVLNNLINYVQFLSVSHLCLIILGNSF